MARLEAYNGSDLIELLVALMSVLRKESHLGNFGLQD